jgi:hypothetical protein
MDRIVRASIRQSCGVMWFKVGAVIFGQEWRWQTAAFTFSVRAPLNEHFDRLAATADDPSSLFGIGCSFRRLHGELQEFAHWCQPEAATAISCEYSITRFCWKKPKVCLVGVAGAILTRDILWVVFAFAGLTLLMRRWLRDRTNGSDDA